MKNLKLKNKKLKGFTRANLLVIVVFGIVIGAAAYGIYRYLGRRPATSILPEEELSQSFEEQKTESLEPTEKSTTATPKPKVEEQGEKSESTTAKGNFSKEGALFVAEERWTLLWDEPGRLALNVKLKFTDQSICYLGNEKKDCGLINMGPQSYDRVNVEGNRIDDEVTVIKLEEVPLPQ